MTSKVREIYKSAIKNEKFLQAVKEADGDKKPNMFSDDIERTLFACMYYGWLVAEYGVNWKVYL